MITKICSDLNCESEIEDQPLENFHVGVNGVHGRVAKCKVCLLKEKRASYKKEHLFDNNPMPVTAPLPPASSELIKQSIAHEENKMSEENLKSIVKSMKSSRASKCYAEFYVEDCQAAIRKLKGLLQVPV